MKIGAFLRNVSYSFGANLISFLISVFMFFFVPKFLPVEDYGCWQLFLFYFSYLGFFHLGWEDGIYLRYAGLRFEELDARILSGQYAGIFLLQVLFAVIAVTGALLFVEDTGKRSALLCASVLIPIVNFNNLCNFVMQITNRIKEYAKLLVLGRVVYACIALSCLIIGLRSWHYFYMAEVCALFLISGYSAYLCRRLLVFKRESFAGFREEALANLSAGTRLMFANVASILVIGIARYGISDGWDVTTFGRVSLSLNVSNFLMIFISAVSVAFFPMLKRLDPSRLQEVYLKGRGLLSAGLLGMMLGYYPMKYFLSLWLPKYSESLIYMAVLFPICLFESKVNLLVNTYLKSLRQEGLLLRINLQSVAVSVAVTAFAVYVFHDLDFAVFFIAFIYGFRSVISELYIERLLDIRLKREIFFEIAMTVVFMVSGLLLDNWWCMAVYGGGYVGYLFMHKGLLKKLTELATR